MGTNDVSLWQATSNKVPQNRIWNWFFAKLSDTTLVHSLSFVPLFMPFFCLNDSRWFYKQMHSCENGQVQEPDWKLVKKQPVTTEELWKSVRKPGELELKNTTKDYKKSFALYCIFLNYCTSFAGYQCVTLFKARSARIGGQLVSCKCVN